LSRKIVGQSAKSLYAALMAIDELTKKVGLSTTALVAGGEKYEKDHMLQPLPSQLCKNLLEDAIQTLLKSGKRKGSNKLIIFIDDLDRCMDPIAVRFLEAIKIYLSIPNCVFVLGLDMRRIQNAIAAELSKTYHGKENEPGHMRFLAIDYLNKIFQFVFSLPGNTNIKKYLEGLIDNIALNETSSTKKEWNRIIIEYRLLPSNPRKIKTFVNGLNFYYSRLCEKLSKQIGDTSLIDPRLTLIFAYLKFMADDIYRRLEANHDFWGKLREFCQTSQSETLQVFKNYVLPEKAVENSGSDVGYDYTSTFPDPSDERLFLAGRLIRMWCEDNQRNPTEDEFNLYLLQE
jgi:hypothetical protein